MLSANDALPLISKYESGGDPLAQNPTSTASGAYQIINGTWQQFAPQAGVSLLLYPTAKSAPLDVQTQVATAIYDKQGFQPWSSNAALIAAVSGQQAGSGTVSGVDTAPIAVGGSSNAGAAGNSTGGTGWFSSIWNYVSRGVLLFSGFILVFLALAALLWRAKGADISRTVVTAAKSGAVE